MKKLIASAGIAAVGAASLQAAPQVGLSPSQSTKPWSISASLRGFYDDNITTVPDAIKEESFGIAVSPSINYNVVRDQTQIGFGYTFGLRWFEDRVPDSTDESHEVSARIQHDVSEGLSFDVSNTFRVAQEPTIANGARTRVIRGEQDYIHNEASAGVTKAISERLSLVGRYSNRVINYDDQGFSGLLDRVEHTPLVHLLSQINKNTVGLIGYRFKAVRYTADEIIPGGGLDPNIRDSDAHYAYVGVDHAFTESLQGSARIGVQFTDFTNAPAAVDDNVTNPFADANLTYGYARGSNLQVGVKHERSRNDLAFAGASSLILDQEQTVLYTSINHSLSAKLSASLQGTFLNGSYKGGGLGIDGVDDHYWAFGVNLNYSINQFLAAEAGYNFDDYDSGVLSAFRSYDRNRVYIGLRASY